MTLRQAVQRNVTWTRKPTVAARQSTVFETLRIRDFRYLCLSNGFTLMGFQMFTMATGWLVLEMTDSKLWVGIVNGLPAAPIIFFSLAVAFSRIGLIPRSY